MIEIRGTTFATPEDAAKKLKLSKEAVLVAMKRNRLDTIGVRRTGRPKKPITLDGIEYDSLTGAALELGVSVGAVRYRLKNQINKPSTKVQIKGIVFDSTASASKHFGVSQSFIQSALKLGLIKPPRDVDDLV